LKRSAIAVDCVFNKAGNILTFSEKVTNLPIRLFSRFSVSRIKPTRKVIDTFSQNLGITVLLDNENKVNVEGDPVQN